MMPAVGPYRINQMGDFATIALSEAREEKTPSENVGE
jgi:hypothetical protein